MLIFIIKQVFHTQIQTVTFQIFNDSTLSAQNRLADDLHRMKFVRHVEQILIVRLDPMTHLSVNVSRIMLVIHCQVAGGNVNHQETVHQHKNVKDLNAHQSAEKEVYHISIKHKLSQHYPF